MLVVDQAGGVPIGDHRDRSDSINPASPKPAASRLPKVQFPNMLIVPLLRRLRGTCAAMVRGPTAGARSGAPLPPCARIRGHACAVVPLPPANDRVAVRCADAPRAPRKRTPPGTAAAITSQREALAVAIAERASAGRRPARSRRGTRRCREASQRGRESGVIFLSAKRPAISDRRKRIGLATATRIARRSSLGGVLERAGPRQTTDRRRARSSATRSTNRDGASLTARRRSRAMPICTNASSASRLKPPPNSSSREASSRFEQDSASASSRRAASRLPARRASSPRCSRGIANTGSR